MKQPGARSLSRAAGLGEIRVNPLHVFGGLLEGIHEAKQRHGRDRAEAPARNANPWAGGFRCLRPPTESGPRGPRRPASGVEGIPTTAAARAPSRWARSTAWRRIGDLPVREQTTSRSSARIAGVVVSPTIVDSRPRCTSRMREHPGHQPRTAQTPYMKTRRALDERIQEGFRVLRIRNGLQHVGQIPQNLVHGWPTDSSSESQRFCPLPRRTRRRSRSSI